MLAAAATLPTEAVSRAAERKADARANCSENDGKDVRVAGQSRDLFEVPKLPRWAEIFLSLIFGLESDMLERQKGLVFFSFFF